MMKAVAVLGFLLAVAATPARAQFTGTPTPNPVSLPAGGPSAPVTVTTTLGPAAGPPFTDVITYTFTGFPAGIATGGPLAVGPPYPPAVFTFSAAAGTPGGAYAGTLVGTAAPSGIVKMSPMTVLVPDFTLAAVPGALVLTAGESAVVTVSNAALGGFAGPITVATPAIPGVSFSPSTFILPAGGALPVTVTTNPLAAAGLFAGLFGGTAPGIVGTRTAPLAVRVLPVPDFVLAVSPAALDLAPGETRTLTVSAAGLEGFAGTIGVVSPSLPGLTFTPAAFALAPGGSTVVTVAAAPGAAPGGFPAAFVGTSPGIAGERMAVALVRVTPAPDFALTASPASLSLAPGGAGTVTVSSAGLGGFGGAIDVVAPTVPGVTFTPAAFAMPAGGAVPVSVTALPGAAPGSFAASFRGTAPGVAGERAAPLALTITTAPAAPDFALSVTPASLSLRPGESRVVAVSVAGIHGFAGPVSVTAPPNGAVALDPSTFTLTPGSSREVVVTAAPGAAPAGHTIPFTGTAAGVGTRTASLLVAVVPAQAVVPLIHAITPPAVSTGTDQNLVRLAGENFDLGAAITSATPGVVVESARVLDAATAEVVLAVRSDAPPGPYRLDLVNPDGAAAPGGGTLLVYRAGALGAPLGVTAAAIVYPRPWTQIALDEPLFPRAILATSGMGTVVGTWLLDGVPFDRFVRIVSGGFPVEVRSNVPLPISFHGEHRLELAIESPRTLAPEAVPVLQVVESHSRIRILWPAAGDVPVDVSKPFRWTLVPGASGYEVEIGVGGDPEGEPEIVLRRRLTDTEWTPDAEVLRALASGMGRFRVRSVFPAEILGDPTPWRRFVVSAAAGLGAPAEGGAGAPAEGGVRAPSRRHGGMGFPPLRYGWTPAESPAAPGSAWLFALGRGWLAGRWSAGDPPEPRREWTLTLMNTGTAISSDLSDTPATARLQASTQTDLVEGVLLAKATADFSGRQDLENPWDAESESENWLSLFGAGGERLREETRIGFAPPSFLDQSEFLMSGFSSGGVQQSLHSRVGSVGYYRSLDLPIDGGQNRSAPEIEAASYEKAVGGGRFLFRGVGLRVEEEPGELSAGGRGEAVGLLGRATFAPFLDLIAEAALGRFEPGEGGFEEERDGLALRLGVSGSRGTFEYSLRLGRTAAGFVNPANRGFTPGGLSGRATGELSMSKGLGAASLTGQYRRTRGGISDGAGDPETTEDAAVVSFARPLGQRISLSLSGNRTSQRGDADEAVGLPRTDRDQHGVDLSLTEALGRFQLGQQVAWQDLSDAVFPVSDQRVTSATLSASGAVTSWLNLSASLGGTRTEGDVSVGRTDQTLLSLQPSLTIAPLWLTLVPRAAISRVRNEVQDLDQRSEQFQLVVQWAPPWVGSLVNLQVASDWNRTRTGMEPRTPGFDGQRVLTLTLQWSAARSGQAGAAGP